MNCYSDFLNKRHLHNEYAANISVHWIAYENFAWSKCNVFQELYSMISYWMHICVCVCLCVYYIYLGAILLNAPHGTLPIRVLAPTTAILPATMVLSTHPAHPSQHAHLQGPQLGMVSMPSRNTQHIAAQNSLSGKSPFRIVPIPSINRTLPEEIPNVSERFYLKDIHTYIVEWVHYLSIIILCPFNLNIYDYMCAYMHTYSAFPHYSKAMYYIHIFQRKKLF